MKFALGIHNHQPVGNFDHIVEDAYRQAYWPFLDVLSRHPRIVVNLHNSGPVWDHVRRAHPEYMELVRQLVGKGQIELLTGGYYEPILPAIPDADKVGQIRKLSDFLASEFGVHPRGMWLAERVWEPHLPSSLAAAGVEYCLLDDTHFQAAGIPPEELTGHYLTEDAGRVVAVVPIHRPLRLALPYQPVPAVMAILEQMAARDPAGLAVFADDGEKFGSWPFTHELVYDRGWLDELFGRLAEAGDWLETVKLSDAVAGTPRGRVYLPACSYEEMMGWALPPQGSRVLDRLKDKLRFEGTWGKYEGVVRGATWRSFLARYPEANRIHKRMLRLSRRIQEHEAPPAAARDRLWRSQCNCAYWHGVFGGLYLPHLRGALYDELIAGEWLLDGASAEPRVEVADVDCDGAAEVLISTPTLGAAFAPSLGGGLHALDYKPAGVNLADTLARRPEAYHPQGHSDYDPHLRDSFLDHFIADAEPHRSVDAGDFASGCYGFELAAAPLSFRMWRDGRVTVKGDDRRARVEKTIRVAATEARLTADYRVTHGGPGALPGRFAVDVNLGMLAGNTPDERFVTVDGRTPEQRELGASQVHEEVREVVVHDRWRKLAVRLSFDPPARVSRYPVETLCRSVSGPESVFQCLCIAPSWDLAGAAAGGSRFAIGLRVEALS